MAQGAVCPAGRRGILGEGHDKALGIFRRTTHVEVNPGPERDVRARLNAALLTDEVPDPRTATLIALLVAGDLLSKVLSPETDTKAAKRRAHEIAESDGPQRKLCARSSRCGAPRQ
ncbi:MAG TPA: GPP34 family phosphoprotein, partial [Tetrasphaera sp.]|nr:GPP34 family phosphoprotein [Tetrasphaera sp.]